MLWQQKFFVNSPFTAFQKAAKGSSLGQVCRKQPDGTWSCPTEEEYDAMTAGQPSAPATASTPQVEPAPAPPASVVVESPSPKPFPIVPVVVGGAAIVAAVLLLGK